MINVDEFQNPFFDQMKPTVRMISQPGTSVRERAVEGVTVTNNFNQIGYTYFFKNGRLLLNYFHNNENVRVYDGNIQTMDDFEKKLKYADGKIRKLKSIK